MYSETPTGIPPLPLRSFPMLPLKFYLPFIQQTQKPSSQLSHDHYLVDESTHGREHRHMKQHPDLRTAPNVVLGTETTNHHNHRSYMEENLTITREMHQK